MTFHVNITFISHSVSPDLGPNCLQCLSTEDKSCHKQGKSKAIGPVKQNKIAYNCDYFLIH